MKDQLSAPHFDGHKYERPNQKWVCGWLCDGRPCRNGPDGNGKCGATADCQPALKEGEGEKPCHVCTRSKELGGPCEEGPRPDGSCSHPPRTCQPHLNLRSQRGLLTKSVIACTFGLLLLILYGSTRWQFISPGEISFKHRSLAFQQAAEKIHGANQQCAACHVAGKSGPVGWMQTASIADPAPMEWQKLFLQKPPKATQLDLACQKCHPAHDFHEPNVAWDYSCSACHQEHKGSDSMLAVDSRHCSRCHGYEDVMLAASQKGASLPAAAFDFQHDWSRVTFNTIRPTNGYTRVIREFSEDHPEFQIHTGNYKDPNTLRFSHATHIGDNPNMTTLNGKKLDCAFCHQPGPGGVYYKNVTFVKNCQPCHALQFDQENPELMIPHGEPAFVHAFLGSLPRQYADFAVRNKKIVAEDEVKKFVKDRLAEMRRQYGSGEELEQKVFFSNERTGPVSNVGGLGEASRSLFPGCAYCHEVKQGRDLPTVTAPVMPERWLNQGRFDHSKHTNLDCSTCHKAEGSREASDILLPSKNICASCHQPSGAARNDCLECHSYHHRRDIPSLKANGKTPDKM